MDNRERYNMNNKDLLWHLRFLKLAKEVSSWSKDPSTQTGAIITDNRRIVSAGYNGLPIGIEDKSERLNNRELKYQMMVHCERNALLFTKENLKGFTLYTYPFASCSVCAGMAINAGISTCVFPSLTPELAERWAKNLMLTFEMYKEAGVQCIEIDYKLFNSFISLNKAIDNFKEEKLDTTIRIS